MTAGFWRSSLLTVWQQQKQSSTAAIAVIVNGGGGGIESTAPIVALLAVAAVDGGEDDGVFTTTSHDDNRHPHPVGILPDGYQQTSPHPQIPTKQSVPTSRECLPGYFGCPIRIPILRSLIGPAIGKA